MKNTVKLSLFTIAGFMISILINSCSPSTIVTGTWQRENVDQNYDKVMVAALNSDVSFKSAVENAVSKELMDEGINTTTSIKVFPPKFIENVDEKDRIIENVRRDGIDAILTISLIDKDTDVRYVPGTTTYAPYPTYGYYGSFWSYYDYWYPRFGTTGYYDEEKTYFMETNLYDANTQELIWSAQSRTYSIDNLENFAEDYADEIADELEDQGLLAIE